MTGFRLVLVCAMGAVCGVGFVRGGEILATVPTQRSPDLPRSALVVERSERRLLVIADSTELAELEDLGGRFLDAEPRENLYFLVEDPDEGVRLGLERTGRILDQDGTDYLVRVTPRNRRQFYALPVRHRLIATEPGGRLTGIGVVIAAVFAGLVIAVLWWLIAVPPQVAAVAAHARRVVSSIRRIVVPTDVSTNWERAVELACRLGEDQKAEVLLTYVIEMPFTLSLGAPMEKAEKTGREVLARAAEIVEHHNLPVRTKIERARLAGEGIARLARDEEADLIVVAAPRPRRFSGRPGVPGRTIEILLHRRPCEVIIDAVPEKTEEEPALGLDSGEPPG